MNSREISFVGENGQSQFVRLSLSRNAQNYRIDFNFNERRFFFDARNYFECLVLIRQYFEKEGIKIKCNGSRYDVYPSPMSLAMGGGIKAYQLVLGKQAFHRDMLDIFDEADLDRIVSVEEQRRYYDIWINSLG